MTTTKKRDIPLVENLVQFHKPKKDKKDMSKKKSGIDSSSNAVDEFTVLVDQNTFALISAVCKTNCRITYEQSIDRVAHFKRRMSELEKSPTEVVIVLINADDVRGALFASILMPEVNWQEIRDRGEIPYARGLVFRDSVQEWIETFDTEAADKLRVMIDLAVVVIDYGVAEVFSA